MEKLLKTDTSLHAELLAEIQKELNVDLNKAKSSQKKEANDDVIKARTLWSVYIVLFFLSFIHGIILSQNSIYVIFCVPKLSDSWCLWL